MWLAWHVAALSRTEKMPDYDEFSGHEPVSRKRSWEEQYAAAIGWAENMNAKGA